jgi:hypothetical protein
MQTKPTPHEFDPSPLYAVEIAYRGDGIGVLDHSPAFDPAYGPEAQRQIDWHRREHGERHVRGWKVREVEQVAEVAESAALASGNSRNNPGGATNGLPASSVTDICALCGSELPETRGGRRRRAEAVWCSSRCRQAAYRQRRVPAVLDK